MFNEGPRLIEPRFCQGRDWIFRLANPLRSPTLTSFDTIRSSGTICARSNPRASNAYTWNEVIKILRGPLIILLIMVSIIPRRVVENHWSDSTLFCFRLSFYSLTHSLSLSLSLSLFDIKPCHESGCYSILVNDVIRCHPVFFHVQFFRFAWGENWEWSYRQERLTVTRFAKEISREFGKLVSWDLWEYGDLVSGIFWGYKDSLSLRVLGI